MQGFSRPFQSVAFSVLSRTRVSNVGPPDGTKISFSRNGKENVSHEPSHKLEELLRHFQLSSDFLKPVWRSFRMTNYSMV